MIYLYRVSVMCFSFSYFNNLIIFYQDDILDTNIALIFNHEIDRGRVNLKLISKNISKNNIYMLKIRIFAIHFVIAKMISYVTFLII